MKKFNTYEVYCDFGLNDKAQRFAKKHSRENTVVEVRALRGIRKAESPVRLKFITEDRNTDIYKDFLAEFNNHDMKIKGTRLYVYEVKEIEFV